MALAALAALLLALNSVAAAVGVPVLPVDACTADARRRYRALLLLVHPDKTERPDAPALFQTIYDAWLTYVQSGARHDDAGAEDGDAPADADGGGNDEYPAAAAEPRAEPRADPDSGAQADAAPRAAPRVRGSAFLLTYNGEGWNSDAWLRTAGSRFRDFVVNELDATQWTVTVERSTRSNTTRYHLHCFIELRKAVDATARTLQARWEHEGARPDIQPCHANGRSARAARDRGHFYVYAHKVGTEFVDANVWPWSIWTHGSVANYSVQPRWCDDLLLGEKISRDVYLRYCSRCTVGFGGRQRNVREAETFQAGKSVQEAYAEAQAPLRRPPRTIGMVVSWLQEFERPQERYPILVVSGPSQIGKSLYARALRPPCLNVVVGDSDVLNLRQFKLGHHRSIHLENLNSVRFLLKWRSHLQGAPEIMQLGESQTGCYAYDVFLWRTPIVATEDHSVPDADLLESDPWLATNVRVLRADAPLWQEQSEEESEDAPLGGLPFANGAAAPEDGGGDAPADDERGEAGDAPNDDDRHAPEEDACDAPMDERTRRKRAWATVDREMAGRTQQAKRRAVERLLRNR